MTISVHTSFMQLIAGTPVDAAIGINHLRLVNSEVINFL